MIGRSWNLSVSLFLGIFVTMPIMAGSEINVDLEQVSSGWSELTDMQFVPGSSRRAVVLEKRGVLSLLDLSNKRKRQLFRMKVLTRSEEGLLGLAFHPDFAKNSKFYLNFVIELAGKEITRVAELTWRQPSNRVELIRTIIDVEQPYPNHNAGQLAFGPDGYLYIGYGDGGAANDPHGHGQNLTTLLGSMIRIDVDKPSKARAYGIPSDNPFVKRKNARPEIWAYGLRNPWRYSFDSRGRIVAGDVGQNRIEELTFVAKGANLGWKLREANECFRAKRCQTKGLVDPFAVYSHDLGNSITAGYEYSGKTIPKLAGKFVFADFGSGRVWATNLPQSNEMQRIIELGRWPFSISSFARDAAGELYALDFRRGGIYKLMKK